MEWREFSSKSTVDIGCCVTALGRAPSPQRALELGCRLAGIGSLGQREPWRWRDAARINPESRLRDLHCLSDEREASRVRRSGRRHRSAAQQYRCQGADKGTGGRSRIRICGTVSDAWSVNVGRCPASVRSLGRRVYVGLLVLLLPVLLGDGSPTAISAACRLLGLSRQTLRRWRRWRQ